MLRSAALLATACAIIASPRTVLADAPADGVATTLAPGLTLKVAGYIEAYYQLNLNWPSNQTTAYRGFDNRSNSFTIENAALDFTGQYGPVSTRIALQVGAAPASYYLAEPNLPAVAGVGPSGPSMWQFVQQLLIGYLAPVGRGLLSEAGIFLSPIGVENLAVKDSWNFSRSNLFYALPYYHAGLRVSYPLTDRWTAEVLLVNGWNDIVNTNLYPCTSGMIIYQLPDRLTWSVLYFGGVENPTGSRDGPAWRNLWDANGTWNANSWLSLAAQFDVGFEHNYFGVSSWVAGAAYVRFQLLPWFFVAGRADVFHQSVASDADGTANRFFFPASTVNSQTATIEFRKFEHISLRVEYRHDDADSPMFFSGTVPVVLGAPVLTASTQQTVTFGATSWF